MLFVFREFRRSTLKKILILAMISVMVLTLSSFAFGEESQTVSPEIIAEVQADVNETNATIDAMIEMYVGISYNIVGEYNYMVGIANQNLSDKELEKELRKLENQKNKDIDRLIVEFIDETNAVAFAMFDRAAEKGVKVVCELIPVEVDGLIVMIDPIRVIGM